MTFKIPKEIKNAPISSKIISLMTKDIFDINLVLSGIIEFTLKTMEDTK